MESTLIRMVWANVETCSNVGLIDLSNSLLVQHLLDRLNTQVLLDAQERLWLRAYLSDRVMLVRDLLDI